MPGHFRKTRLAAMLTYDLSERQERPLYEYLYLCIRQDIQTGAIAAGEKLPSKRGLAKHLGVSLITVEGAYAQLVAEGYVRAVERKGYYACELPVVEEAGAGSRARSARVFRSSQPLRSLGDLDASREGEPASASTGSASAFIADFRGGAASSGLFPYDGWAKALRAALAEETEESLAGASHFQGSLRLRRAICAHLKGIRGISVEPDQVFIGAGAQYLYHMLVQLLGRDRKVALENPGYPCLAKIYEGNGVQVCPVPMDGQGMQVSALRESGASIAHITPSHQFPTGQVTSIARRYELLGWAAEEPDRYLIEDDYDCEFRFAGRPIPALASIDVNGRVIYANTFSKSLGAGFRVGYLVLPPALAERYRRELGFYSCTVSAIDQLALARFMESGSYERHVNRMRLHYRDLRNRLIGALNTCAIGPRLSFRALDAGLHFLMGVQDCPDPEAVSKDLEEAGVALMPLSHFVLDGSAAPGGPAVQDGLIMLGGSASSSGSAMLGRSAASSGSAMSGESGEGASRRDESGEPGESREGTSRQESSSASLMNYEDRGWFMVNYAGLREDSIAPAVAALEKVLGF